jgi:hypothetical protein
VVSNFTATAVLEVDTQSCQSPFLVQKVAELLP